MILELIACVVFLCFLDYLAKKSRNDMMKNIPTVRQIPIIGAVLEMSSFNSDNLAEKFRLFGKKFGKSYKCWIGQILFLTTADLKHAEAILSSQQHITKNVLYTLLREWLGQGLLLSTGIKWQNKRKIITPTFHFKILEQFVEVFDQQSSTLVTKLKPKADGQTVVDIYPLICLTTLDIIAETAMGTKICAHDEQNSRYVSAVNDVTNILSMRFMRPHLAIRFIFKFLKPKLYNKQLEGILFMHNFTTQIIQERRNILHESNVKKEKEDIDSALGIKKRMAFLDVLLQATTSDGMPLSDSEIREEVDTFMFEGHDTTTSAISFALFTISRHPEVQNKLFDEIKAVYEDDLEKPISYRDLQNMKYMNCVVKESLRLYPPIPAIGRLITEDFHLYDCTLPANTNVIILLWEILRDPAIFKDPLTFKPERHMNESVNTSPFSYIPFSAGARNCVGQKFALLEIKCVLTKMLRNYELFPLGEDVQTSIKIVLRSKTGVNLGLKPRVY